MSPTSNRGDGERPDQLLGQTLADFLAVDARPVRYFGPLVEGGVFAISGEPESFKTMAVMHLGLAGASGTAWLGMELGEPRPFIYLSGEKSRATVRDRFEKMTRSLRPVCPVRIVQRAGVTFGDQESWDRVVDLVTAYGSGTFVVCDTIASLAGSGFDENSGRDMAVVLRSLGRLVEAGATVAALHHPNKHGDGVGGIRLRGHSSLWGAVDGMLEFTRPTRSVDAAFVRVEPKDGDLRLIHFRWNRETFLLEGVVRPVASTPAAIAAVVEALYKGEPLTAERIHAEFPGQGRSAFLGRLADTVEAGLIGRTGRGKATRYVPVQRASGQEEAADEPGIGRPGRLADDSPPSRTNEPGSAGRFADEGSARTFVRDGGSVGPPADDSQAGSSASAERRTPPCFADPEMYRDHQSHHYAVGDGWGCHACEGAVGAPRRPTETPPSLSGASWRGSARDSSSIPRTQLPALHWAGDDVDAVRPVT